MKERQEKMWSGRFSGKTSELMETFSRSVELDRLMWREDIAVNRAWAMALEGCALYTAAERQQITEALQVIAREFAEDRFAFEVSDEDIHMSIERRLTELTGTIGARIHSGRSRNDQVMTDARLYLKRKCREWFRELQQLQQMLLELAANHTSVILPGYTHWQQAQPIALSHYLLAIFWGIDATVSRLQDFHARLDVMPLGGGALAGSGIPVNRKKLAAELGFAKPAPNSIDATGNRDIFAELLFIIGAFFTTISKVCAEMQIWNTSEFAFVEFPDAFTTGSSMMPQKKNPDALELLRGRSAAAISSASQILILQKGLPLTYNRDLQEDKGITYAQLDSALLSARVFSETLLGASFNAKRMEEACDGLLLATDLADYLVRRGVPFRQAHDIVGKVVAEAIKQHCALADLSLPVFQGFSAVFAEDVYQALDLRSSLNNRNVEGGTGPQAVRKQLKLAQKTLQQMVKHPFASGPDKAAETPPE